MPRRTQAAPHDASRGSAPARAGPPPRPRPPFRFYDNRQKYLAFVTTCNEKSADRAARGARGDPAAADAAGGAHLRRRHGRWHGAGAAHAQHPSRSFRPCRCSWWPRRSASRTCAWGSRSCPTGCLEHPATVFVVTNLNYAEAPRLMPRDAQSAAALNWQEVRLSGATRRTSTPSRSRSWRRRWRTAGRPGRAPRPAIPMYRASLGARHLPRGPQVPARRRDSEARADLRALRPGAGLAAVARAHGRRIQGAEGAGAAGAQPRPGRAPAGDSVLRTRSGPGDHPAAVAGGEPVPGRPSRTAQRPCAASSAATPATSTSPRSPDDKAVFRYEMHTLPSEIGDRIGTSTLFAAWNAAIYVNQIEDERLDSRRARPARTSRPRRQVLQKHGGLWFNDEAFVVARRRD